MAIPDFQTIMLPLLRLIADRKEHRLRDVVETLAEVFKLTEEERNELLPSGTAPLFNNRVGWANTYLKQAGLVQAPKRGYLTITAEGLQLLASNPASVGLETLLRYEAFKEFRSRRRENVGDQDPVKAGAVEESSDLVTLQTPEDQMASAYRALRERLELELLDQVKSASPAFFERLVVQLLVAMGYGGSLDDAGRAIGKSGDGGIDGIIKEDRLGLDAIYIQAKRWEGTVGRPDIQQFAGALQGQRAVKGVFITTSTYSRDARDYVKSINTKIILIDGTELTGLMVDYGVGVSRVGVYELKRIDSDFFEESGA
ncbi:MULTISPECIES: restriction endonuclease [Xanthomonas]|uniref:Restriction endonuclease n=1 Tax=Xanthomonas rydalmerensis TaxID=3046274 RepID=A0ABZ0JLG6_9XANT|nr:MULTISPECIES: restriction endonuclease [unclassified Xanthomonas]WOS39843.1 restriction endonuclease [Xanthomonas sp. DM-2023]WOS44027.1 restriction endonuclease [Xanthomonas sp. DM-2023]WOS48207.1 restriction endonuclease [Xanthomonas sp. DM-2023]WOS52386.1 restriction endonuclease [Xanthomonas sp. DM-2023]WOS56570.1 restriction endonuclease [Xanthomonas sp. DM-2023]